VDLFYFQVLDYKKQCAGFYLADGTINKSLPEGICRTWKPYSVLNSRQDIEYAWILVSGADLDEHVPENLQKDWTSVTDLLRLHLNTLKVARVPLNDVCLYEVLPTDIYLRYFDVLNAITESIFDSNCKPQNHDFLVRIQVLLSEIEERKVKLSTKGVDFTSKEISLKKIQDICAKTNIVKYNLFGTRTGRLTNTDVGLPVLTMAKRYRGLLHPTNNWYVEFDQNGADLRALVGLLKQEQPEEDIHAWNASKIGCSRDEAKQKTFSWLYDGNKRDIKLEKLYDKEVILDRVYQFDRIITPFNREVLADYEHALNYAAQSTAADVFYDRTLAVREYLKSIKAKSEIAFLMHDAMVLDYADSDGTEVLTKCKEIFADTLFGEYLVNVSVGKNYGEMRKL